MGFSIPSSDSSNSPIFQTQGFNKDQAVNKVKITGPNGKNYTVAIKNAKTEDQAIQSAKELYSLLITYKVGEEGSKISRLSLVQTDHKTTINLHGSTKEDEKALEPNEQAKYALTQMVLRTLEMSTPSDESLLPSETIEAEITIQPEETAVSSPSPSAPSSSVVLKPVSDLTSETLAKIQGVFDELKLQHGGQLTEQEIIREIDGRQIIFTRTNEKDRVYLAFNKQIGGGAFGDVHLATELIKGKEFVTKLGRPDGPGGDSIQTEFDLLQFIHGGMEKSVLGVQKPPSKIFYVSYREDPSADSQQAVVYITKKYNLGNLDKDDKTNFQQLSPMQQLDAGFQVLSGLAHCANLNLVFQDIKGENMLIHQDSDAELLPNGEKRVELVLADLGMADRLSLSEVPGWGGDMRYHVSDDRAKFSSLMRQALSLDDQNPEKREIIQELNRMLLAKDVYAMGKSLQESFSHLQSPDISEAKRAALDDLFAKMKTPSYEGDTPNSTISAQAALAEYQKIMLMD